MASGAGVEGRFWYWMGRVLIPFAARNLESLILGSILLSFNFVVQIVAIVSAHVNVYIDDYMLCI